MYASSSGYADDFRAVLERVKAAGGLSSDIPAFAQGGDHSGGWMMAGENGPELVASGAARVYDAKTTAAIMSAANADMSPALMARIVKSLGQGPDTELVHLRPDELSAAMTWWGGMSINPVTGLPAFKAGGGQGTSASQGGSKSSGKGSAGGGKPGEDKMAQAQAAAQKSGGAKAASTGSGGAKDFDAASAAAAAAFANSTNLAGPNPGDMAGGGIVGGQGYLGQGGTAGNQGSSTLGRDAVDRGWAAYGTQAWSDQQQKVKAAVAAGVSPADITAAATAYAQRLNDYTDRDNSTGEDIANYVASFFGFNEIAPSLDFSNLNPNADWGFDPAGLIGSIVGSALGLPVGGGIIADFISKSMGRPLEMNLGPSVFGDDSQTVTDGVSNALSVQGASDISLGGSTFSANTAMNSPAAGVLSGGDIPRALSSVVNGGQNSVTGGLQSISDRTAQGNETLIQQVQALIRVNKTMSDQLQQLVNSGSLNTEALKQQARGSNQLLSRP
jgi:hypothetical protein